MITLRIGNADRELSSKRDIDEGWIKSQINGRIADGIKPCVKVVIKDSECDMVLTTPSCVGGLGGGRAPNSCEREIFGLWATRGMSSVDYTGGNLVAFLKQLFNIKIS